MKKRDIMQLALDRARAGGSAQADVLYYDSLSKDVEVLKGRVSKSEINSGQGIGIRLIKAGRPGYAYSHRLEKGAVEDMVKEALEQSSLASPLEIDLPEGKGDEELEDGLGQWNPDLETLGMEELKDFSVAMESRASSLDPRIVNFPHVGASTSSRTGCLMNSRGLYRESRSNSVSAYLGGMAKEGQQTKSGFYSNGGRDQSLFDVEHFATMAVARCTELLGARPLPSGEVSVVFSNRVSASIFGMYMGALCAEAVLKGQSRLKDRLNDRIAVPSLEVVCDPTLVGAPGSRRFDSEGLACRKVGLIEEGVLKTFIHNLETAKIMGHAPTGHGLRGIQGKAGMGFSNLLVAKGSLSIEDLLDLAGSCLLVTKLEGGAACSAVSGELSIGVQGFWVEKGKVVHPVEAVTLSGNFFDFIQDIQGLSNSYCDLFQSTKVPDILIGKLAMSG